MAKEEVRKFREVVRDLHGIGKGILGEEGTLKRIEAYFTQGM